MRIEDPLHFVVANFEWLESELLKCMEYIPYIEQNRSVISPKFVPILMEACSLIDSVFRYMTNERGRHTLKSYASMYEDRLELEEATSLLLVSPLQFLRPFQSWRMSVPSWWGAYNQVKHDRISNYSAATYTHAVTALAGLHQVLARSWDFLGHLMKAGWVNESAEHFADLIASRSAGTGPPDMPVETRLFVSPVRGNFVDWSTEPPSIEYWEFTERVKNYIWEHEGW
jgi:hypothetical protein